jgi:hypothetical protein
MNQHRDSFEFNDDLLLFIAEHISSGWFGDFMFNSEKDRKYFYTKYSYVSIWMAVFSNQDRYTNNNYSLTQGILLPSVRGMSVVLWRSMFSKWHERVWKAAWLHDFTISHKLSSIAGTEDELILDSHKSNWVDEKNVTHCTRCNIAFSFFKRKHHCRKCGLVFCESCASSSRVIPDISTWFTSRVCIDCATKVHEKLND